jgi:hypothetical protein
MLTTSTNMCFILVNSVRMVVQEIYNYTLSNKLHESVLFEKLMVTWLVKKFPAFYVT